MASWEDGPQMVVCLFFFLWLDGSRSFGSLFPVLFCSLGQAGVSRVCLTPPPCLIDVAEPTSDVNRRPWRHVAHPKDHRRTNIKVACIDGRGGGSGQVVCFFGADWLARQWSCQTSVAFEGLLKQQRQGLPECFGEPSSNCASPRPQLGLGIERASMSSMALPSPSQEIVDKEILARRLEVGEAQWRLVLTALDDALRQ